MTVKVTVKIPNIKIKSPTTRFFTRLGTETAKEIRNRTEKRGIDVHGQSFDRYSDSYIKQRSKMGRSTRPNLSASARMLLALVPGVRAAKQGFKIILSGRQGFKAWVNEQNGRDFFGLSKNQADSLTRKITRFYTEANRLKKR